MREAASVSKPMNLGIYIQVPFCQTKCTYCNFHTGVASPTAYAPYARAVEREIREWRDFVMRQKQHALFLEPRETKFRGRHALLARHKVWAWRAACLGGNQNDGM